MIPAELSFQAKVGANRFHDRFSLRLRQLIDSIHCREVGFESGQHSRRQTDIWSTAHRLHKPADIPCGVARRKWLRERVENLQGPLLVLA